MQENIVIKGARENNLKNIDVEIPRDKLTVVTGLSGSGKSSLAFDTIYAEGQRRYVEASALMPECFSDRWTNRMWIPLTDSRRPFPLTRKPRRRTPAPRLGR